MKFIMEKEVFSNLPDLVVAVPIIRGFDNTKGKAEALDLLRSTEDALRKSAGQLILH